MGSKGNQKMFGQLIERNRNIFLEKSYTKFGGETIRWPFSKKNKIKHISESIDLSSIKFIFIVCQVEGYPSILKLSCRPLAFNSFKAF